jgi:hypothetical protein
MIVALQDAMKIYLLVKKHNYWGKCTFFVLFETMECCERWRQPRLPPLLAGIILKSWRPHAKLLPLDTIEFLASWQALEASKKEPKWI